jgi:hypothetical protein
MTLRSLSIVRGAPGSGRKPGVLNKYSRELKEAMFPVQYLQELTKFIPREINARMRTEIKAEVTYQSVDDVKRALEEAGMPSKQIEQLESLLPVDDIIDVEAEEVSQETSRTSGNECEPGAETSDA